VRRRFDLTAVDGLALVAVVAAGTALRIPGLTSRDLWFDDAWAALPTKVPLGTAARMVVTTPLYTFAVRSWILLHPGATWWAQLPALVLGIAGIVAVFGLLRSFGFQRAYAYAAAVIVAVGPVTVTYSTRVKEYPADLLFACLVLWLADRWRRSPTPVRIAALGIASAIAIATSASTAAAVGGAVVLAVAMALPRRELRAQTAGLVAGLAATTILLYLAWLRHIPEQLRSNWRTHGFIVGYASLHEVAYSFQSVASGLTHGLLGVPITYTFSASALLAESMLLAVTTAIAIAALVLAPLVRAARSKGGDVDVTFSSAAGMVLGVLGAAAGLSPLGDGRTDEVFYPMLLVLGAGGLSWAVAALRRRSPRTSHQTRAMRAACAAIVAACALWFGVSHRATYPPTGLTVVTSQLRGHLRKGDLIVLDGYVSFTWGMEDQAPWAVSFEQGSVPWPMGFHVASGDPAVILSRNYLAPDASFARLASRTHRIWYVGINLGAYSPATPPDLSQFPLDSPTLLALERLGWKPGYLCCRYSGTYAQLFSHP
jgi:4-amino-4-deoxy-L-arabinose transferase-like glycosyltransferase